MQGVNLARRPFVNRRPVLRLAILLWIAGAALTIHNVRQYAGHWRGTSVNRQDFADVARQVGEEQQGYEEVKRATARVSLGRENRHAGFLNQLIAFRTFPWSALFDDLEEVVPLDVKLFSVQPKVTLKTVPEKARRQRRRRPRPATAAARRSADETGASEAIAPGSGSGSPAKEAPRALRRDEVMLQLNGIAKNEDAVVELIEMLYADPSFHSPFLPGETFLPDGSVKFTLSTVYLTSDPAPETSDEIPEEAEVVARQDTEAGDTEDEDFGAEDPEMEDSEAEDTAPSRVAETGAGAGGSVERRGPEGEPADSVVVAPARSEPVRSNPTARESVERDLSRGRAAVPRSRIRPRALLPGSQPGGAAPGATRPGAVPPGVTRPAIRPGAAAPGTTRPRAAPPGAPRSGAARPAPAPPGATRPGAAPGTAGSGTSGSSGASSQPPETADPDFAEPAASATPEVRRGALADHDAAWEAWA